MPWVPGWCTGIRYVQRVDPLLGGPTPEEYRYECMVWVEPVPITGRSGGGDTPITTGDIIKIGAPGSPDIPPDNVDWDTWFDNILDSTRNAVDDIFGRFDHDIKWAPPLDPPKEKEPTDPIDKDSGPDVWPDWLPHPWEAPCYDCTYTTGGGRSGGTILYKSKYGQEVINEKVQVNGQWVPNPKLAQLGIDISSGFCECKMGGGPTDFRPPAPSDPDYDKDCIDNVNKYLSQFPTIKGCDDSTKKSIIRALYDACKKISTGTNGNVSLNTALNIASRDSNSKLAELIDCMADPNLMANAIKNIDCTTLPPDTLMYTETKLDAYGNFLGSTISIDMQQSYAEMVNTGVPYKDAMASYLLHELTHICTAKVLRVKTEAENWILTLLLYGASRETDISHKRMGDLCNDPNVIKMSNGDLRTENFEIDLKTGKVYARPYQFGDPVILTLNNAPFPKCP